MNSPNSEKPLLFQCNKENFQTMKILAVFHMLMPSPNEMFTISRPGCKNYVNLCIMLSCVADSVLPLSVNSNYKVV